MTFELKSSAPMHMAATGVRVLQPLAILAVTVAAGAFVIQAFDLTTALRTALAVPPPALMVAALALATGLMLSSVRYHRVLGVLGMHIPFRLASRANVLGIIGGLLFFQLLGQTLARTAVLSRSGVGGPSVLLANMYERVTALSSLLVLAAGAVLYLYGPISVDMVGGGAGLLKLAVALVLVGAAVTFVGAPRLSRLVFGKLTEGHAILAVIGVSLYSLLMHLLTLVAFVVLVRVLAPGVAVGDVIAASLIVMFAASVPISFAGWGVREISAVYAYGTLGISPENALAVSILVGLMSIGLALLLGVLYTAQRSPNAACPVVTASRTTARQRSAQIERSLSWLIPIVTAALVFFQVHLPVSGGMINVNLADPVAIGGGLVFLARYLTLRERNTAWRVGNFELMLLAMTAVMAFALVNGWFRFGYSDWAFYNRFVGWFVLLGYLATGALIVGASPSAGFNVLVKCMLAAGLAIAFLDLGIVAGGALGLPLQPFLPQVNPAGMAQNVNAFALQMIVLMAIYCTLQGRMGASSSPVFRAAPVLVLAALMLVICYSHSRSGFLTGAAMLSAAMLLGWARPRLVLSGAAITAAILMLPLAVHVTQELAGQLFESPGSPVTQPLPAGAGSVAWMPLKTSHSSSDIERWFSISRGLELWAEHPLFGNGLGAFVSTVKSERDYFLIIHNTSVWLLTETGAAGFAVFAAALLALVRGSWGAATRGEAPARLLILVLLSFAIFQMAHEVLYQRILWLMFGATLFAGCWPRTRSHPS